MSDSHIWLGQLECMAGGDPSAMQKLATGLRKVVLFHRSTKLCAERDSAVAELLDHWPGLHQNDVFVWLIWQDEVGRSNDALVDWLDLQAYPKSALPAAS